MGVERGEHGVAPLGSHAEERLALVGDLQRVDAEQLAGAAAPTSAWPSCATCSGSTPSSSQAARTAGRTGSCSSSSTTPTPLLPAISASALAKRAPLWSL